MQFKTLFSIVALVATANAAALAEPEPNAVGTLEDRAAAAATIKWFSGAGCTGSVIATSSGATSGLCIWLTNGGSARSISFTGVPRQIQFFESGGAHDICKNGFQASASGSGCSTAPAG